MLCIENMRNSGDGRFKKYIIPATSQAEKTRKKFMHGQMKQLYDTLLFDRKEHLRCWSVEKISSPPPPQTRALPGSPYRRPAPPLPSQS